MNVLSIFDGLSCGQIALNKLGIKIDKYYASEIDKYAMTVTQNNFPDTIQIGDVRNVNGYDYKDIEIIFGGSPCFVAGTPVITKTSIKPIENVKVGDMVLTHKNRFKQVLKIGGEKYKQIVDVKIQGVSLIETTSEHPFYVREKSFLYNPVRKMKERKFSEPIWKKAIDLNRNDFVGFNILNTNVNHYSLTEEECYLIGRYVADGHTRKDYRNSENRPNDRHYQMILSIGNYKLEKFKNLIKSNHFSCYEHTESVHRCVFSNKRLVEIVEENCGCGAANKYVSMKLIDLPINLLTCLLDGYMDGDGSLSQDNFKLSTISENLPLCISLIVAKIYGVGFSYNYHIRNEKHVICGREVNQKNTHTLSFSKFIKKQVNYKVIDDIVWFPVKNITLTDKYKEVFNIEVEEDNSYTANGIIVHNCQSFSFSGKMKGMSTKDNIEILTLDQYLDLKNNGYEFEGQSYLFWEYVRILKEVKPKYFLLENVMMKEKWEKVISETLGVEPLRDINGKKGLNSNLVSAQNRKRLYWTNIPNITPPEDKGITWGDIREHGVNAESYYYTEKAMQWLGRHSQRKNKTLTVHLDTEKVQMIEASHGKKYSSQRFFGVCYFPNETQTVGAMRGRYLVNGVRQDGKQKTAGLTQQYIEFKFDGKTNTITTVAKDNIIVPFTLPNRIPVDEFFFRYITPLECARAQTIPDNYFYDKDGKQYISNSQMYKSIGNGWTVDMVVHIFSFMI